MTSLFTYLRSRARGAASNRLFTPACASLAIVLLACGTDAAAPDRASTGGNAEAAGADAGKTATRSAGADAGRSASSSAEADASDAVDPNSVATATDDDAGGAPSSGAPAGGAASSPAGGAPATSDGATAYSWPADCETHYTFLAHDSNGAHDTSKKQVVAGAQYYASYYFRAPWATADVQGLKFRSIVDNKKIVHHWILYGVDSSTEQDGAVQGGVGQATGTMQGEFYIAGWAPGAPDVSLPDDVGLHMPTGASATFRLEVHYYNTSATAVTEQDASGVEFCTSSHKRMHEAAVHWMGTTNVYVPAGMKTDLHSTCAPKITNGPVHMLSLSSHMHKTGVHSQAILKRANGGAQVMLIDDSFAFMEQNAYRQPRDGSAPDIQIEAGDTIDVTCSYDNMTAQDKRFGSNTEDEMCFFYALAWPRGQLSNGSLSIVPGAEPEVNCIK